MSRGQRLGWRRQRRLGLRCVLRTPGTMRFVRQAHQRFEVVRAGASGWLGWRNRLATGSGVVGPQPIEHEEEPHQCNEPELAEKEGWYHGNAPADDGEMRAFYETVVKTPGLASPCTMK